MRQSYYLNEGIRQAKSLESEELVNISKETYRHP